MTSRRGWKRPFDEPIMPRGREIVTLEDAGHYISSLPKADQLLEEWQACSRSVAPGRRAQWDHHDGAHRFHEGIEPERRAGV
jgi:hypothetical protein